MKKEMNFTSVETMPMNRAAVFTIDTSTVFKDDTEIAPIRLDDKGRVTYMPWGADNEMPYKILSLIEDDETLATCQIVNAELFYGQGLVYNTESAAADEKRQVEEFTADNALPDYFLGVCQDFNHFGFCVTEFILSNDYSRITHVIRKEACYCRFAPVDASGNIPCVHYANWRKSPRPEDVETVPMLRSWSTFAHLQELVRAGKLKGHKVCMVTRWPTPDSTYYPIPYYAALFKGRWYNIKQLIAQAKESKLRNSAPIKYLIEIAGKYWEKIFAAERITDRLKQIERVKREKQQIIDFITGAENAGKVLFSTFYVDPNGNEQHDVRINNIEAAVKEGGDWASDHAEAVNMFCFVMRIHSNLVGSVPGKTQSNNSGSDKRELYTISQASKKPYHDLLFQPHRILMRYNGWTQTFPQVPMIQLTTLDEHKDMKTVNTTQQ